MRWESWPVLRHHPGMINKTLLRSIHKQHSNRMSPDDLPQRPNLLSGIKQWIYSLYCSGFELMTCNRGVSDLYFSHPLTLKTGLYPLSSCLLSPLPYTKIWILLDEIIHAFLSRTRKHKEDHNTRRRTSSGSTDVSLSSELYWISTCCWTDKMQWIQTGVHGVDCKLSAFQQ